MTTSVPASPKIYHITHVNNLASIVAAGRIWSDAERIARDVECELVGLSTIKKRRLEELEVGCCPGTKVGQYVPFYFCPRSIMLYILHRGNAPDLDYRGGQSPIIHVEADLETVLEWAKKRDRAWAFSIGNAGARYADFYSDPDDLRRIDWDSVKATDFRAAEVKEGKQAEFLLFRSFPLRLIQRIGVMNDEVKGQVLETCRGLTDDLEITVQRGWYF
jgi:hypothetical protein